ncbi:hypothetical protein [Pseudomonas sp.]|uniref:hypothetical protein n=1 Tax=Pseudomonas sp. TaxID=306 RepID=UPI00260684CE|nr:hypothetical protein [Pseudomonas sp.]
MQLVDTGQVAEMVGRTPSAVRVALHRRSQQTENGLLRGGRHDLRAGVIPEPHVRVGLSPAWDMREILRWRAYSEGAAIAERVEAAICRSLSEGEIQALLMVLRYPVGDAEFYEWFVGEFEGESR